MFCGQQVVDSLGQKTAEYGIVSRAGRHVCARCMKALEFSIGG